MHRFRLLLTALALLALVASPALVAADGELLLTPEPLPMGTICEGSYTTSPGGGAASATGSGVDCAAAQYDLQTTVAGQAHNYCINTLGYDAACNIQTVQTSSCTYNASTGEYEVEGYADHSCKLFPRY